MLNMIDGIDRYASVPLHMPPPQEMPMPVKLFVLELGEDHGQALVDRDRLVAHALEEAPQRRLVVGELRVLARGRRRHRERQDLALASSRAGTIVCRIASSTGMAAFSRGLMRPSDIGRRTSALNMFAKRSADVP